MSKTKKKIDWYAVRFNISRILFPLAFRNYAAETIANILPRRVVGWVLFRACIDYKCNSHITLMAACKKYKNHDQTRRGV